MGADPAQPQEVSRKFSLDKTLTWRIARTLGEENAWDAVYYMPRRPSMVLLTQALRKAGAPVERVNAVLAACDAFESFIHLHAGDRDTFEIMVAGQAQREGAKRLEQFRKDGFAAASAVWGVSAKAHIAARFVLPSASDGRLDLMTVCGFFGFRRLRQHLPWAIATASAWQSQAGDEITPVPLPCCDQEGAPVLRLPDTETTFSTRSVKEEGGRVRFVLEPGHIGSAAATDVLLGWIMRNSSSQHASTAGEVGEHGVAVNTPTEQLVHDLIVHESLAFARPYEAALYSTLANGPGFPSPDAEEARLPVPANIVDIGRADTLHLTGYPSYVRMLKQATRSIGRELSEFRAFRVSISYPPVPSMLVQRHPLLEPL